MGKIVLRMRKKFCYHIGIVCVTGPNLLKRGIRTSVLASRPPARQIGG